MHTWECAHKSVQGETLKIIDEKPVIGDDCDFCLGCVQHCKARTLTINDEFNPEERYRNPNIKISEIIKSNKVIE